MGPFEQPGGAAEANLPFEEKEGEIVLDVEGGAKAIKKQEELQEAKAAALKRAEELKQFGPRIAEDRARGRDQMHLTRKPLVAERQQLADDVLNALGENIDLDSKDKRDDQESREKAA